VLFAAALTVRPADGIHLPEDTRIFIGSGLYDHAGRDMV